MNRWFNINVFRIDEPQSHKFAVLFTNISDRKAFEQERERFFAVASDLQVITRTDGYFQWVSPTFERLLGWTPDEMTCRPWTDFVHPDDINPSILETDSLFLGNETLAFENRYRHKDGSYRWLLWRAQPQPEEQVIYGAAVDISDRKQAEAALRESEAQFRQLANTVPQLIWTTQPDGTVDYLNEGWLEYTGMMPQAFYEWDWQQIVHPDDLPDTLEVWTSALRTGELLDFKHRLRHVTGEWHWQLVRGIPLQNEVGQIVKWFGTCTNIHESEMREQDARFLSALGEAVRTSNNADELMTTTAEMIGQYLQVKRCCFAETDEAHDRWWVKSDYHSSLPSMVGEYRVSDYPPVILEILRAGDLYISADNKIDPRTVDYYAAAYEPMGLRAHIVVPFYSDGRWAVNLLAATDEPRQWQAREINLLETAAERIWLAVEKLRSEQALRESEEQIRNILESINDGFFALDENWQFTYVNQAAETLTGRLESELIGKIFWEEFSGVKGSEFEQMHRRVMRDRVAASHTAFYPDHDRWYEVNTYPAANGITAYFRNVTDQIQAAAALRQSQERYRTLFESIDEGFCVIEVLFDENDVAIDYRFLEANPAFEQQTGLEQAIGKSVRQIVPKLEEHWFEIYGNVALTGEPARFENKAEAMNRWFDVYAFRIEQPEHRKVAILFKDITERQRTEAELQTQRQLLETVVNYLPNSVAIVRGRDLTFQFVNPLYQAIAPSKEMVGRTIQEVWPEMQPLFAKRCRHVLETGEPYHAADQAFEITHSGTGLPEEVRYFSWSMHRITLPSEDEQGILITIWETTDRKQAEVERERLLQQAQAAREEAENANRIKDEFLAVLSHELRSPLNPILGWTRLLQSGKLDTARQREALSTIERNAKLQTQLIEDLLDISRIMQGKLTLTATPVNLTFVISAAIETVRLAAEAKNIGLQLDLDSTAPIFGDAARLQQVVWNLLTNAVKFTPNGGQVTVELSQIDQLAQIRVMDTGKGINSQFLPHVFEYFRQEDGSTTRKFGGLGLGLAIVRQIVELHGGTVTAESLGENQGATFTVQLPILQQAIPAVPEPTHAQAENIEAPLSNLQILVVDDDDNTREFQAFVLQQSGARVTAAASGLEALQVLDRFIPDVLISDVGMAEMDGYILIQQIRARPLAQGGMISSDRSDCLC